MKFRKAKFYQNSTSLSGLALQRFKRNKLSMFALIYICIFVIIAVLGYLLTPDKTPFANNQNLELSTKKPGFKVKILNLKSNQPEKKSSILLTMIYGKTNDYEDIPIFSYKINGQFLEAELFTGMTPNNGEKINYELTDIAFSIQPRTIILKNKTVIFKEISGKEQNIDLAELQNLVRTKNIEVRTYLLGTDRFGRDLLSQLIIGSRVSLSVGFIAVFISLIIGISLGLISGYLGGKIDELIIWFINVVWSIPTLLLVIAITMALGKGFWQVFIAVGLTMWVEVARVVRGQVMSIRNKEFVEAGIAFGYSNFRILFRHVLPNILSPVIVISAANFASAILIEAGLSFLGIGVQPPVPSWGTMIKEHYGYIILDYAYLAIIPGLAIMLMVLTFMIVGNGLRDALDVKTVQD
ncbi:MAG: peptide transporter [Bacteroidetes bacterium CG2_30_33_31]|nr:MAG: peptide transporter [Bacteroidetes bacterium CG2_30_33_31]